MSRPRRPRRRRARVTSLPSPRPSFHSRTRTASGLARVSSGDPREIDRTKFASAANMC